MPSIFTFSTILVDIVWLHCDSATESNYCCDQSAVELNAVVVESKILVWWTEAMKLSSMALCVVLLLLLMLLDLPVAFCDTLAAIGYNEQWMAGHATWYGEPLGEGSSGGACGYTKLVGTPYGPRIAAGNDPIFQGGGGCGQCYEVKCNYPSCKSEPTRVVITDQCPGGTYCSTSQPAFDLSGAAISDMAISGKEGELRNIGLYDILYKRVPCEYPNQNIAFQVDAGSTSFWLSLLVKYIGGPGDISSVEIRQAGSSSFQPAKHNWGASWMLINTSGQPFKGPYDVKIVSKLNGHTVIAEKVIPEFFEPGKLYESNVQMAY